MAPPGESHGGQHLGAEGEAPRGVWVVQMMTGHGGFREALAECDALVGRLQIKGEFGAICRQ